MTHSNIWFFRHAQSVTNAGEVVSDTRYAPLSEKGKRQRHAIPDLIPFEPDLIIATPYIRTQQTAEPTVKRFPKARYEIWPLYEFGMLSHATYGNKTSSQRKPYEKEYWERNDPDHVDGPGAESFAEMVARIKTSFAKLQTAPEKNIVVFTHGRLMQAMRFVMERDFLSNKEMMSVLPHYFAQNDIRNCALLRATANEHGIHLIDEDRQAFEEGFHRLPKNPSLTFGDF